MAAAAAEEEVRPMERRDLDQVNAVWRATGLAEGLHTVGVWFEVDPGGFFVATVNGEVVGCCAGIALNDSLGFVGLYAVKPEFRGRGLGVKVWKAVMDRLGPGRNIGLNSVPERLTTYRDRAGFSYVADWSVVVYSSPEIRYDNLSGAPAEVDVLPLGPTSSEDLLGGVISFDKSVHGYDRRKIVLCSVSEEESLSLVATDGGEGGRILGYGIIRPSMHDPALLGPLYAESPEVAEGILKSLLERYSIAREKGLILSVIDNNPAAMELAEKIGLRKKLAVPRCHTKAIAEASFQKVYGMHALNFSPF